MMNILGKKYVKTRLILGIFRPGPGLAGGSIFGRDWGPGRSLTSYYKESMVIIVHFLILIKEKLIILHLPLHIIIFTAPSQTVIKCRSMYSYTCIAVANKNHIYCIPSTLPICTYLYQSELTSTNTYQTVPYQCQFSCQGRVWYNIHETPYKCLHFGRLYF